jgi:TetR/AcrR family transcriptional repressor of nem operon
MRYDIEHKERTHRLILAEAANAIRTKGPDRVAVAEVMGKAGLTHGGFYAHFSSKDELIAQALTFMLDQSYARFLDRIEGLAPRAALSAYLDFYLSSTHRDAPARGCPLPTLSGELSRLPASARTRFTEGVERFARGIGKLLEQLGTVNPQALASSALAEMVGALALSRAVTNPGQSEQILKVSRESIKARLGLAHDASA